MERWLDNSSSLSFPNKTLGHPLGSFYPILKDTLTYTLITLLMVIMLAMGCIISWKEVRSHVRRPIGVLAGMLSQYVLLPLVGFGLAHALKLAPHQATGLIVLACSPGGTSSNIYTYFAGGDVSLSIVMTTMSTLMALGLLPLNLLIYTSSWISEDMVIPYAKISVTLVLIIIPVAIGMIIRWKFPKLATIVSKIGSAAGTLAIISTIIMQIFLFPNIFIQPWKIWLASVLLPIFGFMVGYLLSLLFRQPAIRARTIAIETGSQNVSLAMAVLILTFPDELLEDMSVIPLMFSIFVLVEGFIFCICCQIVKRFSAGIEEPEERDDAKELELNDINNVSTNL